MLIDDPKFRKVAYLIMVLLAVAALVLKPINDTAAQTVQDVVTYLAGLFGFMAASNVPKPVTVTTSGGK